MSIVFNIQKIFSVPAPCNAPSDMARIIRKMCSYRAENRYQMVKEIITDLNQIDQRKKDQESKEYDDFGNSDISGIC